MNNFKFAFFGTPDIASQTLDILFESGYTPKVIITSPDAPSGRGMEIHESKVSEWAQKHNIKCLKPEKIDESFINEFKKLDVELSIVVAYGKILKEELINAPSLGTINIHYSLLPKWRGASPLESCLLNEDEETGVSIQQMVFKLDSGPIIAEEKINIDINETKNNLKDKLISLGGNLLSKIIPQIIDKSIVSKEQDESLATYCKKINKEDGEIKLDGDSFKNYNKYRAFYGWPGVFFFATKHGKIIRVKIKDASYENDSFVIKRVTPEGKKEVDFEDFLRSN